MASTTCAFCGRYSHMTPVWRDEFDDDGTKTQIAMSCDNCGRLSVAVLDVFGITGFENESFEWSLRQFADELFDWYPLAGVLKDFPDVPDHIARAAKEAHANASINSPMSAILMARTVVEATAKAKNITTGRLIEKIDALAEQGFIREHLKEAAHEIRIFGNDMAHGDIEVAPDEEDVNAVLVLMDEVLAEVFQGPARIKQLRHRRTVPKAP